MRERKRKVCATKERTKKNFPREIFNYLQFIRVHNFCPLDALSWTKERKRREFLFFLDELRKLLRLSSSSLHSIALSAQQWLHGMRVYLFSFAAKLCRCYVKKHYLFDLELLISFCSSQVTLRDWIESTVSWQFSEFVFHCCILNIEWIMSSVIILLKIDSL